MSQSTTDPTYGKRHYSWAAPSTQSSEFIIKSDTAAEHEKAASQQQSQTVPAVPRRSSFNYEHDSAQFPSLGNNSPTEPTTGQTKEKKPFHQRQGSYTMEDQKRMQHELMLKTDLNPQGFSES